MLCVWPTLVAVYWDAVCLSFEWFSGEENNVTWCVAIFKRSVLSYSIYSSVDVCCLFYFVRLMMIRIWQSFFFSYFSPWASPIICVHRNSFEYHSSTLSCPSSSFNPTLSMSLLHESFHLVFCLPLHLFPGTGTSTILLSTCHSSLLLTCPYNFSLLSVTCYATGITFTDPLTC